MMGVREFLLILAVAGPALLLWIAVIIFVVVWLRRGGGRAERFLLAGASLKLAGNLLNVPAFAIIPWLISMDYSITYANMVVTGYGVFTEAVGMAGIICLVYAFWVKFKAARSIEAKGYPADGGNTQNPS